MSWLRMCSRVGVAAVVSSIACSGCESGGTTQPAALSSAPTAARSVGSTPQPTQVEIIEVSPSEESLQAIVLREEARAREEGRDLLIYVGAEWCEPCKRFHDAAKAGQLDAVFPTLRLLELDRDADEARLQVAGCITRLIPLFARPTAEGGCDLERSMTGSVKGPGAIANITPRLQQLLAR